jgi:excinuclease UvrABC ATPase subunit
MYSGSYEGLLTSDTLTALHLGRKTQLNLTTRMPAGFIESGASSLHNLKSVSLRVPLGVLTVVTGVAGSGKSTLVHQVFAQEHPEAVLIDQSPVQANSRSNPATFTDIMTPIRNAFAAASGVPAGLFSYNSDGACPACNGTGVIELNLSFMDKMEVECSTCNGSRFREDVLSYRFKGKTIVDVMAMTVDEAVGFFEAKDVKTKLEGLHRIGLDDLTLGQPLDTLSGGECQRLRLARELHRKGSVFILDEPTTGLHMSDIDNLLRIIDSLVKRGNTVVVIEHNLDVIRRADWIIDMGPDGGSAGGRILYEGPLEGILSCEQSITARYLH